MLAAYRSGHAAVEDVLGVFARSRVLIPLLTVAGDLGETPDGRIVDKTQELSIVTVHAPDGRSVLPVFSSVTAMHRWNPEARPIPNFGRSVAMAALEDENDLVILDPATDETEFGIRRPALWSIAQEAPYTPPWRDDEVLAAFRKSVRDEPSVTRIAIESGDPHSRLHTPEVRVVFELTAGLTKNALDELLARVQQRWAQSNVIAERVDSMTLRVTNAS